MVDANSPILDFYPTEFEQDLNGKKADWEAIVKIPFIDEKRLLKAMRCEFQLHYFIAPGVNDSLQLVSIVSPTKSGGEMVLEPPLSSLSTLANLLSILHHFLASSRLCIAVHAPWSRITYQQWTVSTSSLGFWMVSSSARKLSLASRPCKRSLIPLHSDTMVLTSTAQRAGTSL